MTPAGSSASQREGDHALLHAWQRGDADAARRLVERYTSTLLRFFAAHVHESAADLVQQTWAACVAKHDRIEVQLPFRAFLFGVARKELLMYLRRHYRRQREAEPQLDGAALDTSPSQRVARLERSRALQQAVQALPPEARMIVQLAYWEELPLEQIAMVLEVPVGTVKSRLFRARGLLRDAMEQRSPPTA